MTKDSGDGRHFGHMKNVAEIGDIVLVAGFPFQEFQVEAYSHNLDFQDGYVEEDITYDVTDISNGEYLLAFQEDINVIVKADWADRYIASRARTRTDKTPKDWAGILADVKFTGTTFGKSTERPRGEQKYEQIDELLDELSDVNGLIELFGEHEDDEIRDRKYILRKTEIEAKLFELTGGDK